MKTYFRYILLAVLACCNITVFADTDEEVEKEDNDFYGTTPYIELKDMPDLYSCMP